LWLVVISPEAHDCGFPLPARYGFVKGDLPIVKSFSQSAFLNRQLYLDLDYLQWGYENCEIDVVWSPPCSPCGVLHTKVELRLFGSKFGNPCSKSAGGGGVAT
jgi:hypothetical protein